MPTPTGARTTKPAEYVATWTRRIVETAERHGLDHHVWIQAFEIAAGHEPEIGSGDRRRRRRGGPQFGRLVLRRLRRDVDMRVR